MSNAQAASVIQSSGCLRIPTPAAHLCTAFPRPCTTAVAHASAARTAYPPDHHRSCALCVNNGSIATGYASSASRDAAFDSANNLYGNAASPDPANHDCSSGLLADNRKYGNPTDISSTPSIDSAGFPPAARAHSMRGLRVRNERLRITSPPWTALCALRLSTQVIPYAYKYPVSSMT